KLHKIIPADPTMSFEKAKDSLYKDAFAKLVEKEIPVYFGELKKQAAPNILLKGPPSEWQGRRAGKGLAGDGANGARAAPAGGGAGEEINRPVTNHKTRGDSPRVPCFPNRLLLGFLLRDVGQLLPHRGVVAELHREARRAAGGAAEVRRVAE